MTHPDDFTDALRSSLTSLAKTGDRVSPSVFAGRDDEFELLGDALLAARRGEVGRTVVVSGVPGVGKTALMNEYANRLMASEVAGDGGGSPVIPVPLRSGDINAPPAGLMQAMDRQFVALGPSRSWRRAANRFSAKASWLGNALTAIATKKNIHEFRRSAQAPDSLDTALAEYAATRFGVKSSTFVLLVDEAQNIPNTDRVKAHLEAMHLGIGGSTKVQLVCFGLGNTVKHLAELGLSRLASGHARSIGALSDASARTVVEGTVGNALTAHAFDHGASDERERGSVQGACEKWIATAANVILSESANFPHHLANGCHSLARIILKNGIGSAPPVAELRAECRRHKRDYYDARLLPWEDHATALANAFSDAGWTPVDDVMRVLMAADEYGASVRWEKANAMLKALRTHGYVEFHAQSCRPALPSLASHFAALRREMDPRSQSVRAIQQAKAECVDQAARQTKQR